MFEINGKAPERFKTVSTDLAFMFLLGFLISKVLLLRKTETAVFKKQLSRKKSFTILDRRGTYVLLFWLSMVSYVAGLGLQL